MTITKPAAVHQFKKKTGLTSGPKLICQEQHTYLLLNLIAKACGPATIIGAPIEVFEEHQPLYFRSLQGQKTA
jgi:hypothetical protein